jgi:signal transduction histidine kinase
MQNQSSTKLKSPAAPSWSLRSRLVWISAGAVLAAMALGGTAMYWAASIQEQQMLDSRLEHLGATILSIVEEELEEELREVNEGIHTLPLTMKNRPSATLLYQFQVWTRHGNLAMRSHEASATIPLVPIGHLGFSTARIDGELHRTFALPTRRGELIIQVAENTEERWAQVGAATAYYMAFLIIPFGLVIAITWYLFTRSLQSINTMADQLRDRSPQDVTPISVSKPPREMLPILGAVDSFFARTRQALSFERRFTSVAAHEMRTPLAGLRAHAQLAGMAQSQEDLAEAIKSIMVGVDRASYMLEQLLDLARIEELEGHSSDGLKAIDIGLIFHSVMSDLGPVAAARDVRIESNFQVREVVCLELSLQLLLSNLIGNAIKHSPEHGRVVVSTRADFGYTLLTIDDQGPGIPPALRHQAFERFERLGKGTAGGVGLGLSIVRSVIQSHHATITLDESPLGGLRVRIRFANLPGSSATAAASG